MHHVCYTILVRSIRYFEATCRTNVMETIYKKCVYVIFACRIACSFKVIFFTWAFCHLTTFAVMGGTVSQFPPSVNAGLGDTVTMHCQLNGVQSFCHTVAWLRVDPVTGMIDILQDSSIPYQSNNLTQSLVCKTFVYNARQQDSGTYYCVATDREHMYLGNGTVVIIKGNTTCILSRFQNFNYLRHGSLYFLKS